MIEAQTTTIQTEVDILADSEEALIVDKVPY